MSRSQQQAEVGKKDLPTPMARVNSTGEGCKRRQEEADLTGPWGQSGLYIEGHAGLAAMEAPLTPRLAHPLLPQLPPKHLSQARCGAWQTGSTHPAQRWVNRTLPSTCTLHSAHSCRDKYLSTDSSHPISVWVSARQTESKGSWQVGGQSGGPQCLTPCGPDVQNPDLKDPQLGYP